ncbi:hypothetical protein IMCC14465_09850 [alpha proteobacterium IMCC14465]|uniref:Bifunctional purine biosynthesis protein PurH n=1 Tax=alpha proteobacterium IMCC14465 TaxID=1220535 RepID=J9DZQ5_9PROT|nr:hypothetical protein IMCC14465_09850 [alpha proteobacterium IMCC14465]
MVDSLRPVSRALISVSDKDGIVAFATALAEKNIELVSTGGTADTLSKAGLAVRDVSELTGYPDMMDGRVKTLHPGVHGGLLAIRDNETHKAAMAEHDIQPIDMLVVNLYPFEKTLAAGGDFDTCIENIDIGGPAMIRAAAKNHGDVAVIVDHQDFATVLTALNEHDGKLPGSLRKTLAQKAYARTAAYDAAISNWFADQLDTPRAPAYRSLGGHLKQSLRYGENPHQNAGFYVGGPTRFGVATATQIQGKELSFNNINDTNAAFELVSEMDTDTPACAIIKHANPCGVATATTMSDAFANALKCDPVSAFGGIIALNKPLDAETAAAVTKIFTEVIIAPDADEDARAIIGKKKNVRLLLTGGMPDPAEAGLDVRTVSGGLLVQNRDNGRITRDMLQVVTKRQPDDRELEDMLFAFRVAKHVKSNAIVYAKNGATVGIGAGQMSRIDSARIAASKSEDAAKAANETEALTKGSVVASDAFFPFADGLISAAQAGVTAVIQPGGSIRDDEVIAAADEAGLAMVVTGMRHFKH